MSFISDIFLGGAEKKAAKIQAAATTKAGEQSLAAAREAITMLNKQYETTRTDLAPYRKSGYEALSGMSNALGMPGYVPDDAGVLERRDPTRSPTEMLRATPGYQFMLDEGSRAINARNAATGSFYSGRPMRELARYATGLADTTFGEYFQRLAQVAGLGSGANSATAQAGADAAQGGSNALQYGQSEYGSALIQAGASRASGVLGQSQAIKNTLFDFASMAASIPPGVRKSSGYANSGSPTFGVCWVAREVYGVANPAWLVFRQWLLNDAPQWLLSLYMTYGERFAEWIHDKPRLKAVIKYFMDQITGNYYATTIR